jgi:hypothetical protein
MPAKVPFRTEIQKSESPSATDALFRIIDRSGSPLDAKEVDALAFHPDERVPMALVETWETDEFPPALWQRAQRDLEADGVAWTPLFDRLIARGARQTDIVILVQLEALGRWLREEAGDEATNLLEFRTPGIAHLVATEWRRITPEGARALASDITTCMQMLNRSHMPGYARRALHLHLAEQICQARADHGEVLQMLDDANQTLESETRAVFLRDPSWMEDSDLVTFIRLSPDITPPEFQVLAEEVWYNRTMPSPFDASSSDHLELRAIVAAHPATPEAWVEILLDGSALPMRVAAMVDGCELSDPFQHALLTRLKRAQKVGAVVDGAAMRLCDNVSSKPEIWAWANESCPNSVGVTRALARNQNARAVPELRARILEFRDPASLKGLWQDRMPEEFAEIYAVLAAREPEWMIGELETHGVPAGARLPDDWMLPLLAAREPGYRARAFALLSLLAPPQGAPAPGPASAPSRPDPSPRR